MQQTQVETSKSAVRKRTGLAAQVPPFFTLDWEGELLTQGQAAKYLKVAESILSYWRSRRTGPPCIKLSANVIRYRTADLRTWIASRTVTNG